MKFTIYSGFYNNVEYLNQIWEGIKNQTYTEWEWIISDDFSDNIQDSEVLREFADNHKNVKFVKPRWKREFYYNPPVEYSTGDIMLVQDVDDYPSPKLLEVYKYHFDKFPSVELIMCSSMVRNYDINGSIAYFRDSNYSKCFNFYEATLNKFDLYMPAGDVRAYRIRNKTPNEFSYENQYITFSEDMIKIFNIEKRGEILFLPRILHTYTQYSKSSVSHKKINDEEFSKIKNQNKDLWKIIHNDVEFLDTINHYYDMVFDDIDTLLFNDLYLETKKLTFDVWNKNISSGGRNRLRNLYFDNIINFNSFSETSDCAFFKIKNNDDLEVLNTKVNKYLNNGKKVIITSYNSDLNEKIESICNQKHFFIYWNNKKRYVF